uniref:Uncharacterized protein n=1 Tax=Glossina brevipalpis TaxID=37001 RepID=A0A1A9WCU7_9MUSC
MQGNAMHAVISVGMKQKSKSQQTKFLKEAKPTIRIRIATITVCKKGEFFALLIFLISCNIYSIGCSYTLADIPVRSNSIAANTPIEALLRLQGDYAEQFFLQTKLFLKKIEYMKTSIARCGLDGTVIKAFTKFLINAKFTTHMLSVAVQKQTTISRPLSDDLKDSAAEEKMTDYWNETSARTARFLYL